MVRKEFFREPKKYKAEDPQPLRLEAGAVLTGSTLSAVIVKLFKSVEKRIQQHNKDCSKKLRHKKDFNFQIPPQSNEVTTEGGLSCQTSHKRYLWIRKEGRLRFDYSRHLLPQQLQ